jgi:hypothetical protein
VAFILLSSFLLLLFVLFFLVHVQINIQPWMLSLNKC